MDTRTSFNQNCSTEMAPIPGCENYVTGKKNNKSSSFFLTFSILFLSGVFLPGASAQNSQKVEATYKVEILREIAPVKEAQAMTIINKTRAALGNLNYLLKIENGKSLFEKEASLSREEDELYDDLAHIWTRLNVKTYTNQEENLQVIKKSGLGKEFLVKENIFDFQWQLSGEKKLIHDFPVQKATGTFSNAEGKLTEVVAWYTSAIPVQFGPDIFQGLPGLILEVEFAERRIFLTQVEINPDKIFNISEPVDGETLTLEEYRSKEETAMDNIGL